jgi:hypothetical protein
LLPVNKQRYYETDYSDITGGAADGEYQDTGLTDLETYLSSLEEDLKELNLLVEKQKST